MSSVDIGIVFCSIALFGVLYPHLIYPAVLWICRVLFGKPVVTDSQYRPTVDILVSAYNEEEGIQSSLNNLLASVASIPSFRILVGDDGSTDGTAGIIEAIAAEDQRVHLVSFSHQGKNATLDQLISVASAEIIVFADADCAVAPTAVALLLEPFSDSSVGAVISRFGGVIDQRLTSADAGDAMQRGIEDVIIRAESELHSTVASNGTLYAVRREYVTPIRHQRVADDLLMLLRVLSAGKRVVQQPLACVYVRRANSMEVEFKRTVRTASGGLTAVWLQRHLLLARPSWVSFFLWSHRVARWCSPLALLLFVVGSALTYGNPVIFDVLLWSQLGVLMLAAIGRVASYVDIVIPIASTAEYFIAMNISLLLAWKQFLFSTNNDSWNPGRG